MFGACNGEKSEIRSPRLCHTLRDQERRRSIVWSAGRQRRGGGSHPAVFGRSHVIRLAGGPTGRRCPAPMRWKRASFARPTGHFSKTTLVCLVKLLCYALLAPRSKYNKKRKWGSDYCIQESLTNASCLKHKIQCFQFV